MKTSIEQFPVELWMTIFSYLEAHQLLQAFMNLNSYFDELISSDYLLFNVQLGKVHYNPLQYSIQLYWPDSILQRIISLRPTMVHKTSHIPEFLRWHATKLSQLKSLNVKLRGREIPTFCIVLQELHSLQNLSLECIPNEMLLETILSTQSLRFCRLDLLPIVTPSKFSLKQNSQIERIEIKLRDYSLKPIINLLLNRMLKLKTLEIHSMENYLEHREENFSKPLFVLPELRTTKIYLTLQSSDPKYFENLCHIAPNLKYLYFNIVNDFFTENLFMNLFQNWWPIIEKVPRINVLIKCRRPQVTIDHDMSMNLNKFQSNLLTMSDHYKGSIDFQWTERFFITCKIIEISICTLLRR